VCVCVHMLLGSTSTSKKSLRKLVKTRKITQVGSLKLAVDKKTGRPPIG